METRDFRHHLWRFQPSWSWALSLALLNTALLSIAWFHRSLVIFIGGRGSPNPANSFEDYDTGLIILAVAIVTLDLMLLALVLNRPTPRSLRRDLILVPGGRELRVSLVTDSRTWILFSLAGVSLLYPVHRMSTKWGDGTALIWILAGVLPMGLEALGILLMAQCDLFRHRRFWVNLALLYVPLGNLLIFPSAVHIGLALIFGPLLPCVIYALVCHTARRLEEVPWISADAVQG